MKGKLRYLMAAALAVVALQSRADIVNGSFETGTFAGWTTSGTTAVIGAGGGGPIQGAFQAYLDTSPDNNATPDSSSISQSFTGASHVKFYWNFLTNELTPSTFNDFAQVILDGTPILLADTTSVFVPSTLGGYAEMTGYHFMQLDLGFAGTHTITFLVSDAVDGFTDSALLIDTVNVPEPASLALFSLGLAGFGFVRRRRAGA